MTEGTKNTNRVVINEGTLKKSLNPAPVTPRPPPPKAQVATPPPPKKQGS